MSRRSSSARLSASWNMTQFICGNILEASRKAMFIMAALLNTAGEFYAHALDSWTVNSVVDT